MHVSSGQIYFQKKSTIAKCPRHEPEIINKLSSEFETSGRKKVLG
jgi:hypothetical protein